MRGIRGVTPRGGRCGGQPSGNGARGTGTSRRAPTRPACARIRPTTGAATLAHAVHSRRTISQVTAGGCPSRRTENLTIRLLRDRVARNGGASHHVAHDPGGRAAGGRLRRAPGAGTFPRRRGRAPADGPAPG